MAWIYTKHKSSPRSLFKSNAYSKIYYKIGRRKHEIYKEPVISKVIYELIFYFTCSTILLIDLANEVYNIHYVHSIMMHLIRSLLKIITYVSCRINGIYSVITDDLG